MKQIIQNYFESWIEKDVKTIRRVFAQDIVYTECYGPQYHGLDQIVSWFNDWNERGSVLEWTIRRIFETGKTVIVEWYFKCDYDQRVSGFDGVTIADFNDEGKIFCLKEFQSKADHVYPYD
jgi:ketosteroid isomerase-like protein